MSKKSENDIFYKKLTQVWFALVLFNIAINVFPLISDNGTSTVAVGQAEALCAADNIHATGGGPDCPSQVSAGAVSGISPSSSGQKIACATPAEIFRPMGVLSIMGFWPSENLFGSSNSSEPCSDRAPPLA